MPRRNAEHAKGVASLTGAGKAPARSPFGEDHRKADPCPGWTRSQSDEFAWWVRGDWSEALVDEQGLKLDRWRESGRLSTVKTGPHRVVYRADLPEGSVFVKHFLVPNLRAKLRQWFRRGKGRNEGSRAAKLAEIGVPTITPIALGERRVNRFLFENFLITQAIPDTLPLDNFFEQRLPTFTPERQETFRRALLRSLADLTAKLHDAGIVHLDFHPGNLLIQLRPDDTFHLAVIDLDALRVSRRISWNEARKNLARLDHFFWVRSDRLDRYRFLVAYLKARRGPRPDARSFALQIEQETRAWAERLWRRWGRRCWGRNKYFDRIGNRDYRAYISRDLDPRLARELLGDPEAPLLGRDTRILKDSSTALVAELQMPVQGMPTPVIYKKFRVRGWFELVLNRLRPSPAERAWQGGQHLRSRGIPTPQNLAYVCETPLRWLGPLRRLFPSTAYVLMVKAEPSVPLSDYIRAEMVAMDHAARRGRIDAILPSLARLIRDLHERSLSHRDLKAANVLLLGDRFADSRLSLIDLVGVALEHPLSEGRRLQNLARLQLSLETTPGLTRTDSLRFLRMYLPDGLSNREAWKSSWRGIVRLMEKKRRKNLRRGRPIS